MIGSIYGGSRGPESSANGAEAGCQRWRVAERAGGRLSDRCESRPSM